MMNVHLIHVNNGATCQIMMKYLDYSCKCLAGFSGDNCEIDIDDCASNPCIYGAIVLIK